MDKYEEEPKELEGWPEPDGPVEIEDPEEEDEEDVEEIFDEEEYI